MRVVLAVVVALAVAAGVAAQTVSPVYNPQIMEFESVDHANTAIYRIEVATDADQTTVLASYDVPATLALPVPNSTPQLYRIVFADAVGRQELPMGTAYRWRLRGIGATGSVGEPSNWTNTGRFVICESGGAVNPMTLTLGEVPTLTVGHAALVPLTVVSPKEVRSVTIDLVTDGLPAWYFPTTTDVRNSPHLFVIGPFVRAQTSLIRLMAVDALGCTTDVTPRTVTVVPQ